VRLTAVAEQKESRAAKRLELATVLVMSFTAIITAWTGFQNAKWSGVQAIALSQAGAARTESVRYSNQANQQTAVDVSLFSSFIDAAATDQDDLAQFYRDRFPERLAVAVDAWEATDPLNDPEAPSSPFAMDEYANPTNVESDRLAALADVRASQAQDANQTSDNYVMLTIMFAAVLFFSAMSSRMDAMRSKVILFTLAVVGLAAGLLIILTYPVEV
jgi:hypothetical protein